MSIDLSRPLVPSQGQHDPLDGLITYQQLSASGQAAGERCSDLAAEIDELAGMCEGEHWQPTDPLGLGGLLVDLYRTAQLLQKVSINPPQLFAQLLDSILPGVRSYAQQDPLQQPAAYRLGFRELGFSIGLRAVQRLRPFARKETEFTEQIEQVLRYQTLADEIEASWRLPANREVDSWTAHRDINEVMLATSLAPDGYLGPS